MKSDIVISGGRVVFPEKTIRADVAVSGSAIDGVFGPGTVSGKQEIDASGCYVLPGLIDPHVHPVYLDDISAASKSAAFGGITTLVHYAYARPGNKLIDKIKDFRDEGLSGSYTDFALHGGLFETLKQADEIPQAFEMGVTSFKVFMAYAKLGWMTDDYAMSKVMDIVGRLGGMVAVHAETGLAIDYIMDKFLQENTNFAERFLETSPDIAEGEGIFRAVSIGRLFNCPVYIPHVSSKEGVQVMQFLKSLGVKVFAETCPQYLGLTWDELKEFGPLGKVGPSIKTEEDRQTLWEGVRSGLFDTFGSDHAPKDKKTTDDFFEAAYGSPEIETMLPVIWHNGVNSGCISPNKVVELLAENTAKILGLFPQKGRVQKGADADLVLFDPSEAWTVTAENQHTNAKYTLFEGQELLGRVKTVIAGGDVLVEGDEFLGSPGNARFLATKAGTLE